jgi:CubicO group peptidase (beta-lactamase class C family)
LKTVGKHKPASEKLKIMKIIRKLNLILICVIFFGSCCSKSENKRNFILPIEKWTITSPEAQGVDSDYFLDMFKYIKSVPSLDLHSLLIIRNGVIISETYWFPYDSNTTHNIKSASKSILSALTGIAIDKGCIENTDQKIIDFLPDGFFHNPLKNEISVYNLLTMTTGLQWKENSGPYAFDIDSWNKVKLNNKPGKEFNYNTGITHMMSAILTRTCGVSTKKLADLWLFKPVGIANYQWRKNENGIYHGGSDLFLAPRDMGKFGLLYLNYGYWGNQRILDEKWIKTSTSKIIDIPSEQNQTEDYGYWWWIKENSYMAYGAGGQIIEVNPKLNTVIVITANSFATENFETIVNRIINEYIYPATKSTEPIPEKPNNMKRLNTINGEFSSPGEDESEHDLFNNNLSGYYAYNLTDNPIGINFLSFFFSDTSCEWTYKMADKVIELKVGLKNRYLVTPIDFSMGVNPKGEKIACRGRWINDVFELDHHIIGDPSKQIFYFTFKKDSVNIDINANGMEIEISGEKITESE